MESSHTVVHLKILRLDLEKLLKSINDPDHDIYLQRTILRDGIKTISERCEDTIKLLESEK